MMPNETVTKLYKFIAKLVLMLEEELDELKASKSTSAINAKKNITGILAKLVIIIIQLNKLSKDPSTDEIKLLTEKDSEIINRFLEKYNR